jgi:23S rRNA (adenine2030-N6)-methyltransferase
LLQRAESRELLAQLKSVAGANWLYTSLTVQTPSMDGFGMHGSALFIVNPPYNLPATLQEILPYLVQHLGLDQGASFELEHQIN